MLLDIGLGIFGALWVSSAFTVQLTKLLVLGGILFALLPDADYLIHLLRGNNSRNAHKHRDLLHYPLVYILIGGQAASLLGKEWLLLFIVCSLAHFLHDSIGIGWGVQWLWPFRDEHYSFFYIYKPRHRPEKLPRKLLYIWKHAQISELSARYGDEEWIRNIYLRVHPYAIIELIVCLAAVAILFFRTK